MANSFDLMPVPIDAIADSNFGGEHFMEIHLDERYNAGENMHLCKVWHKKDGGETILETNFKMFHNADQCINFITSYEWRKVFLTLTDHYSYVLELVHNLPQIVFLYIYSQSPHLIKYNQEEYPKLRAIVQENSPDADKQLLYDIEMFRRDVMPINVVQPIKRKTKLLIQEALSVDECVIVLLQDARDSTIIDTSFVTNIIKSLKIFFDLNQSIDFIKSCDFTKVFFISAHANSDAITEKIGNYSQVIGIFILHPQPSHNNPSTASSQQNGIYSNIEVLSEELLKKYELHVKNSSIPMSVFLRDKKEKTVRDLNKDNTRFLWFQLLIDILIQIPYNDQAKDELLFECRKHYGIPCEDDEDVENKVNARDNHYDRNAEKQILYFEENYKPTEALKYYSQDSFLYRVFNRAFRTENIDLLFICRFFLADMYKQLQKLYLEQYPDKLPQTVYRGQFMTNAELNSLKNNVGRLMSINTFLSTTLDNVVAEVFSGFGADPNPNILSVVFEITIDVTRSTSKRPFAAMGSLSVIADESEVLFSVGSMFRIESVEDRRTSNGYWYAKLKTAEDDTDINEFRNELEKTYLEEGDICTVGEVLMAMGDYERAERYFRIVLEYTPEDHQNTPRIYACLGRTAGHKGDHQKALEYHQKALDYCKKPSLYNCNENIGREYVDIGVAHQNLGDLDLAMKYFTMAADIQKLPASLSYTYNQIGLLHRNKRNMNLALEYFLKTLHIEEQILKTNQYNSVIATMYNNIGEVYTQLGDYENALKYLQHALDVRLKGTVSTHTDLAAIYLNLGNAYRANNELKKALEFFNKALELDTQTFGNNNESLAPIHNSISDLYSAMNNFDRALYHAETSLRILLKSQAGENHAQAHILQRNIGTIQFQLGNYTKALKITTKALQNQLRIFPENDKIIAHTYSLLSKICQKVGDMTAAFEYMKKALEIARISILPNDKSEFQNFQTQWDRLISNECDDTKGLLKLGVNMFCLSDDCGSQVHHLSKLRKELEQTPSDDILARVRLLNNIGSLYSKQDNHGMAIQYFNEAVEDFVRNKNTDQFFVQQLESAMAHTYFGVSRIYYKDENWIMSLNSLQKSLELTLKQQKEDVMLAEIYHAMGLSNCHLLDVPMGIHYFELAISTARKIWPDNHPRLKIYLDHLRQLKPSM